MIFLSRLLKVTNSLLGSKDFRIRRVCEIDEGLFAKVFGISVDRAIGYGMVGLSKQGDGPMTKIIDTASIRENDLISFRLEAMNEVEITGIVANHREDGMFNVETIYGLIAVEPSEVTDIC